MNTTHNIKQRRLALKGLALALTLATAPVALAQGGGHPLTIVVPFPPGSTADLIPRLVAPILSHSMGTPVIVENRPGATGSIGAVYVAHAEPNGQTLLLAPTAVLAANPWLYKDLKYNAERDFAPIIRAASTPNVWVTYPAFPAKSLADVVALARSNPAGLSFGSGGKGTSHHLCGELLRKESGANLVHVPYKGPAPALQDVLAGQIPLICDNLSNVLPHIRSGRLRPLAVTSDERLAALPDVPTAKEQGYSGGHLGVWYGFVAPAATPRPVVERLNAELASALHAPEVQKRLDALGLAIDAGTPESFAKQIATDSARMHALIQSIGVVAD